MKNMTSTLTAIFLLTSLTTAQNYSLSFDGNDDYVTIPHSSSFNNNTISISVWVYLDTAPSSSESYLLFKGTDTGSPYTDRYWGLRLSGGSNMHVDGEFVISGSYYIISSNSVSLDTGNWHHILLTYDGSEIKLIIDSIEVNSLSASGTLSSGSDNVILAYMPPVGYPFSGYLDAVSIWDRAISSSEINGLLDTELTGSEDDLVGYWNFNEGTGTTLTDQTSNGNDGTINGATWSTDVPGPVTYYVATNGSDDNDGSEENPFATIQAGIDAASDGDTVLVADGTYYENTLDIIGKYVNVISVNGPESTIISGNNSYRVLYVENGEDEEILFSGFTLTNGRPGSDNHASALKVQSGLIVFNNLIIENNGGGTGNTVAMGSGIDKTYFIDTIVRNNSVENYGGLRSSTNIRCVLYGNSGSNNTGVLLSGKSINCVVVGNGGGAGNPWTSSGLSGGSAINCIFWGNSAQNIYDAESVTYSNVQGAYSGEGNINTDPIFGDGYTLQENSPCIDTGDPASELDPDGTRTDMGAYFYDQSTPPPNDDNYSVSFEYMDGYASSDASSET
ncbi:MAG: hypothetical protein HN829_04005, partial [Candidatus Marinimicrobia bacterium]|nr:hypothetical protein [Candidatus Neomarinimicrobiota bacterium]